MSEREPSPEFEYLTAKCGDKGCKKKFEVRPENSRINRYSMMPDCDYVFTHCPHCEEYYMRLFIKNTDSEGWKKSGIPDFDDGEFPPPHIIQGFRNVYGEEPFDIRKFEDSGLTQRQERLAWFVAYLLHKEYLTVEDFDGEGDLYL